MNGDETRAALDSIVRMAREFGYRKIGGRSIADYDVASGGLELPEVIHELYNHVAIVRGCPKKSLEEITKELEVIKATDSASGATIFGSTVLGHIGKIGDVVFECDITQDGIDITSFEKCYGSMEEFVKGIWRKRIADLVTISVQSKKFETVEV